MPSRRKAKPAMPSKRVPPSKPTFTSFPKPDSPLPAAIPPARNHTLGYHYPLLLDDGKSVDALLRWFEGIEEKRSMPWRKKWIDPEIFKGREGEDDLDEVLARRAYEVWVSEIMLQQTRVSTVIPYFKSWIAKWPTVQDLAEANHDDVLAAWKGLGYYSRATRLHEGSKAMIAKSASKPSSSSKCLIPSTAEELQQFPGIGRYTAGAISSIAFGVSEPVLDGNVIRVLSRQLGVYADSKDKKINDKLWDVADLLVKSVGRLKGEEDGKRSKAPGMWNQALMELGSTVCTPRPKCEECPIQGTCRGYAEGAVLARKRGKGGKEANGVKEEVGDIEDACALCEGLDTEDLATAPEDDDDEENEGEVATKSSKTKKRKVEPKKAPSRTISHYFAVKTPTAKPDPLSTAENDENLESAQANDSKKRKASSTPTLSSDTATLKRITAYCSLFPKKIPKKKVAEEEAVICIIELLSPAPDLPSKWLIEQRPAKGLLASLWQFPQSTLPSSSNTTASRKAAARNFLDGIDAGGDVDFGEAQFVDELGSLVHVFSHLKLTMHVQRFRLDAGATKAKISGSPARKWVAMEDMDGETLSTGMRRCWDLVKGKQ
ncbi:DNA glycosylase [Byssothecium circinans]|uniref:Adenine DNA glycosylase n=1 Tax=Byssothecium circinans TaxID=147558 RepID=A0A6A5TBH5_9PLEO|nr:DNA glycosylase [Byssothecium circinans]